MTMRDAYAGLRVLELASVIAGPFATMVLADLGADVVKIENPHGGDDSRRMPPHVGEHSTLFHSMNRNKRSLALDLKSARGRDALLRLVADVDVVVEGYRPGVSARLGVDYAAMRARNPKLIYCSISAFGHSAAGQGLPGYDPLIQAFVGLMSMTGDPGAPPARVAASIIDLSTGMWAAMGIMAALAQRSRGGEGQYVEATLIDSGYMLLCHQITSMLATGVVPTRIGSASPIAAPYEAFQTADGWLMITAGNDPMFERLCAAIGLPELSAREEFRSTVGRVARRHELATILQERLKSTASSVWIARLQGAGVPVAPVQDLAEAVKHPLMAERGMLVMPEGSGGDAVPLLRVPFDDARPPRFKPAPAVGQHTVEILSAAGFSAEEIDALTGASGDTRADD